MWPAEADGAHRQTRKQKSAEPPAAPARFRASIVRSSTQNDARKAHAVSSRARNGMKQRAMKTQEGASAPEITHVIEIGRNPAGDQHGGAKSGQKLLARPRQGGRRQRVCERIQRGAALLGGYAFAGAGTTRDRASGTMRKEMGAGPMGSPSTCA